MTKIKLHKNTNTVLVYKWMKDMFGNDEVEDPYEKLWSIVLYGYTDETYLEIYKGEPEKITFAIIRWS
jgi:hypothetical protein